MWCIQKEEMTKFNLTEREARLRDMTMSKEAETTIVDEADFY